MSHSSEPERRARPRTTDSLRHEIDSGRTGDKVAYPDPAAAPLGTDDEAAGTPAAPEDIAKALESVGRADPRASQGRGFSLAAMIALIVAVALVMLSVLWQTN
jgi:hypothetical protein